MPCRTYSLLRHVSAKLHHLKMKLAVMFKNYGSCLSTWEGKRCITETDALTLFGNWITAKFGIPFRHYLRTIYEAN